MTGPHQPARQGSGLSQALDAERHDSGASHSLRRRLLSFLLLAIFGVAVLQAIAAYRSALQQADAMFDDHLQQVAQSMHAGAPRGSPPPDLEQSGRFELYVQIWGPDGTPLFRSSRSTLPPHAVLGFSELEANGNRYRVYSLQTPSQTVQIAQDMGARTARARALALQALLPFALLTPLLMLAVWWVINRSLAPVERARRELALRAADDFSPLASRDLPDEVRPLVRELNLLFGRVRQAFDAQKNFVADAAHELRSPLTALKLQAQALRRRSSDPADLETAVARLNQGIDRTIHLVEQLLVLAREEAASADVNAQPEQVDLSDILRQAIADVLPQATARNIDLGVCEPLPAQPLPVRGQSEALRRMLRNLLDNAVKYSPPGSRVDIRLALETAADGRAICLMELRDSGPGIAEEDRVRVFDRFYRASDVNLPDGAPSGSGLGLAIVEVIARRHGVAVTLGTSAGQGGLRVLLRFTLTAGAV